MEETQIKYCPDMGDVSVFSFYFSIICLRVALGYKWKKVTGFTLTQEPSDAEGKRFLC